MGSLGRAFANCVNNPVSLAAAKSSKPPAPSLYPGSTETLLGFFSRGTGWRVNPRLALT
jgi:hypothetical protein